MFPAKRTTAWFAASMALCSIMALSLPVRAAPQKPKATAPAPLPPIAFDLRVLPIPAGFGSPFISDMNNGLQAVGFLQTQTANGSFIYDGFMYDYDQNVLRTIDDLISPADMTSLVAGGWTQSIFRGINDLGLIVGEVKNPDTKADRGLILDTRTYDPNANPPTSATVYFPDSDPVLEFPLGSSRLRKVNNRGDIFGNFLIQGTAFVFNPGLLPGAVPLPVRVIAGTDGLNLNSRRTITDSRRVMLSYQGGITAEYDIPTGNTIPVSSAGNGWLLSGIHESGRYFGKKLDPKNSENYVPIVVDWVDGSWKIVWQQNVKNGITTAINGPSLADLSSGINQGDIITREVEYVSRFNWTAELYLYSPKWGKVHMDKLVLPDQLNDWKALVPSDPLMSEKFLDTNFGAIADSYGWMLVPVPFTRTQ